LNYCIICFAAQGSETPEAKPRTHRNATAVSRPVKQDPRKKCSKTALRTIVQ